MRRHRQRQQQHRQWRDPARRGVPRPRHRRAHHRCRRGRADGRGFRARGQRRKLARERGDVGLELAVRIEPCLEQHIHPERRRTREQQPRRDGLAAERFGDERRHDQRHQRDERPERLEGTHDTCHTLQARRRAARAAERPRLRLARVFGGDERRQLLSLLDDVGRQHAGEGGDHRHDGTGGLKCANAHRQEQQRLGEPVVEAVEQYPDHGLLAAIARHLAIDLVEQERQVQQHRPCRVGAQVVRHAQHCARDRGAHHEQRHLVQRHRRAQEQRRQVDRKSPMDPIPTRISVLAGLADFANVVSSEHGERAPS